MTATLTALVGGFTLGYALRARRARVANRRLSRLAARQHRERLTQLASLYTAGLVPPDVDRA